LFTDNPFAPMLSLKPLPIVEHWDCHGCGLCCHGSTVPLDDEDLSKLQAQKWDEDPSFRGAKTVVRTRIAGTSATLAHKSDGSCVFLTAEGRCRIHELHGFDAKPKVCRQFPLQLIPLDGRALVAARRSCPSAARGEGPSRCGAHRRVTEVATVEL
jgi:lysine-N-methylase